MGRPAGGVTRRVGRGRPHRPRGDGPPAARAAGSRRGGRATSPVLGVVLLVAIAVAAGATVGAGLLTVGPPAPPPRAALSLSVDPAADRLALTHLGGDPLDVRELSLRVLVDGEPLSRQPPVPFFAARGFRGGPTGPFNVAADPEWGPGETASLRLASTNAPALVPGSTVTVVVAVRGATVARLTRRAGAAVRQVGDVDRNSFARACASDGNGFVRVDGPRPVPPAAPA